MSQDSSEFEWSAKKEDAALLVAQDELTDEQIAERVGIARSTLTRWKTFDAFVERVDSHIKEFRDRVRRRGIAIVENRVAALQDRVDRMRRVIAERAASPDMQDVPGGSTGLLVHNVKSVGGGENAERVDLYEVDTGLLKELREHERQAAQELGQWLEKTELSQDHRKPIRIILEQEAVQQ